MEIFRNIVDLTNHLEHIRKKDQKIGFIPTMGSIHQGHNSLIKESLNRNLFSISSIYVNPSQFNNKKDFTNYPKDEAKDLELLKENKCSAVYLPNQKEIYPEGIIVTNKIKEYRNILCDRYRSGHFDGVTTVIEKLFSIIKPQYAFFGEKDFQQLKIIKSLMNVLKLPIQIVSCPSIRDSSGMSLSSRYKNFNKQEKIFFWNLSRILKESILGIKKDINNFNVTNLKKRFRKIHINKIDYIEIRDEENLLLSQTNNNSRLFIALYINNIRIVDNFKIY